jgi:hypothetical protein
MRLTLGRDVAITAAIMGATALGDSAIQVALVLQVHESTGSAWAVTALLLKRLRLGPPRLGAGLVGDVALG